jgi:hypothetical protein
LTGQAPGVDRRPGILRADAAGHHGIGDLFHLREPGRALEALGRDPGLRAASLRRRRRAIATVSASSQWFTRKCSAYAAIQTSGSSDSKSSAFEERAITGACHEDPEFAPATAGLILALDVSENKTVTGVYAATRPAPASTPSLPIGTT